MRVIPIFFFLVLVVCFNSYSQRIILPENNENFVYEVVDKKLNKIGKIDFPITNQIKVEENGTAYCLDTANHKILITNIQNSHFNDSVYYLDIPESINPISLEVYKQVIFLGGDHKKEKIYAFNLNQGQLIRLEIPSEIMQFGKSVDDFCIIGDTLVALDNIVMPKYLLFYDLSNLDSIKFLSSYTVPPNGTYENLMRIIQLDKYFVILSSTFNWAGAKYFVTVIDRYNLPDYSGLESKRSKTHDYVQVRPEKKYSGFTVSNGYKNYWHLRREPTVIPSESWTDIVEKNGEIYFTVYPNKIGNLKIKEKYFKVRRIVGRWYNDEDYLRIIDKRKIKFSSTGKKTPKWFVKIPNSNFVFLVYQDSEMKYQHKLF